MPVDWPFAEQMIRLHGVDTHLIDSADADRQAETARAILAALADQPGILLGDEVGMGKTYIALAACASVILATNHRHGPVVIMVPGRLRRKWQREWQQFKRHCVEPGALAHVRDAYADSPSALFKLLDDPLPRRARLIFVTTGCFSRGLDDGWIKLAMIRLARTRTRLSKRQKTAIYRYAPSLVRLQSKRGLDADVVEKLMNRDVLDWKRILVAEGILSDDDDDPVPKLLPNCADRIGWRGIAAVIKELPQRKNDNLHDRLTKCRKSFADAQRKVYQQWLCVAGWRSPLLVLDEAHHAKNDTTRLARLFRPKNDEVALLRGTFNRMLFLTATPFQLGHHELIQVLRSFGSVRWNPRSAAPTGTRDDFCTEIAALHTQLDETRRSGKVFDRLWGQVHPEHFEEGEDVERWWQRIARNPQDPWEHRLVEAVEACRRSKDQAEKALRRWVIRHNRPGVLPCRDNEPPVSRRCEIVGRDVVNDSPTHAHPPAGLSIESAASLPFLLAARAQGELAHSKRGRVFFAEGLASSYEAFHHTRDERGKARDMDDEGYEPEGCEEGDIPPTIVPINWYEEQVGHFIPSRHDPRERRLEHPKVKAAVQRALQLWTSGEKVLIFCFYRQTCRALYEQLREEVRQWIEDEAVRKLGGRFSWGPGGVTSFFERIRERFAAKDRPFYRTIREVLDEPFRESPYRLLHDYREELIGILASYTRSPSFVARYLPLEDPAIQQAFQPGEGREAVLRPALDALRRGLREHTDASGQTFLGRVYPFLDYVLELAERGTVDTQEEGSAAEVDNDQDESLCPLKPFLKSISDFSEFRGPVESDVTAPPPAGSGFRAVPLVRMLHGDVDLGTRERVAWAFNSPLFPEILVCSAVMGEGIDLHRFCRHVIHHDGYWNPSTREQQTGRIDRIRCKAEVCHRPIHVYQPFLAGSADEKMFRVLTDRERWFQVVMGEKVDMCEQSTEALATRVPLPEKLARELSFNLARWRPTTPPADLTNGGPTDVGTSGESLG